MNTHNGKRERGSGGTETKPYNYKGTRNKSNVQLNKNDIGKITPCWPSVMQLDKGPPKPMNALSKPK